MLFGVFLTLGVAVLSVGLRSFQNSYLQKAGALGILAATFLTVFFITGSWIWGLVAAMAWLFLPWLEILTRNEGGNIRLGRKSFHILICLAIFTDVNLLEAIAFLAEIIFRIDTPRAPLATVQL